MAMIRRNYRRAAGILLLLALVFSMTGSVSVPVQAETRAEKQAKKEQNKRERKAELERAARAQEGKTSDSNNTEEDSDPQGGFRVLTQGELDALTNEMKPDENGFYRSTYSRPEEIEWNEVLYDGAGLGIELTKKQYAEYESMAGEIYTGITAIPEEAVGKFAFEKTGVPYELARNKLYFADEWTYWGQEHLYIHEHGDTNYVPVVFTSGAADEEKGIYQLHYYKYDWKNWRAEREFVATVCIEDGNWCYLSNVPADAPAPVELVRMQCADSEQEAKKLAKEQGMKVVRTIEPQERESDEPAWYWWVVSASTDDVHISVNRQEIRNGFEEEIAQELGLRIPREFVGETDLDEQECVLLRANLAWYPDIMLQASSGAFSGEYWFGEDNYLHLQGEDGSWHDKYIMGHDLFSEGRGVRWKSEEDVYGFLEGDWVLLDDHHYEAAAAVTFSEYRSMTIRSNEKREYGESSLFRLNLDYMHIYTDEEDAPDTLSLHCYDEETKKSVPDYMAQSENWGDYFIEAFQQNGEQYLRITQANNGDGALDYLLPDVQSTPYSWVLKRYTGTASWKSEYWRHLYNETLEKVKNSEYEEDDDLFGDPEQLYQWFLYDINKDGTPELIKQRGNCEANYHAEIYTCENGLAYPLLLKNTDDEGDYIGMSHTSLYSVPGENGILLYWGHMGYMSMQTLKMEDLALLWGEVLMEEDISQDYDAEYTRPEEMVSGSTCLTGFDPANLLPLETYSVQGDVLFAMPFDVQGDVLFTMPYDAKGEGGMVSGAAKEENNREEEKSSGDNKAAEGEEADFYTELRQTNGTVYAVAADSRYMNSPGRIRFSDMTREGVLYDYSGNDLRIRQTYCVDLNGDNVPEQVLYLANGSEAERNEYRVILSCQGERVYAYTDFAFGETGVDTNGVFYCDEGGYLNYRKRAVFREKDCFTYYVR